MESEKKITAGIIGAGRRGKAFLESLVKSQSVDIRFIVDRNPQAPAFALARQCGVPILFDIATALRAHAVEYIFEATGDEEALELLGRMCSGKTQVINFQISLFFFDLLDRMRESLNGEIVCELTGLKKTLMDNSRIIQESSKEMDKVAVNIMLLSINAGIEASRAGDVGKGFGVVAQAVKETADNTRTISRRIEDVNRDSADAVNRIDSSLKKLSGRQ